MVRYLRLFAHFVRFSFSRAFMFRLDFWFRVVMDCLFYVVQLGFFYVIYRQTDLLGGWNLDQILIFTSAYMYLDAVNMTLFSNNMWWLPSLINRGDLDYYLVRPVSSIFFVSLRDFAANSFMNLIIATSIVGWAIARYPGHLGAGSIVLFFVLLASGTYLFYLLQMCFLIPTFWLHSAGGMREILWNIEAYANRPHQIYAQWLQRLMLSIIPLAFIASVPAHVLFDGLTPLVALHIAAVLTGATVFTLWLWRRGLRAYSSASS